MKPFELSKKISRNAKNLLDAYSKASRLMGEIDNSRFQFEDEIKKARFINLGKSRVALEEFILDLEQIKKLHRG